MASTPPSQPVNRIRCFTRALKNARFLQRHDPATFAKDHKAEGFGTGVPMNILHSLHRLRHDSPELHGHQAVAEFLKSHQVNGPQRWVK